MSGDQDPEWNPSLEELIKKEGEQCESLFWLHNEASQWASKRNNLIQIPAILLASATGFLSATSELLPPVAIGAMSLTVGALNTINSYYKYSQRSESHRISAQLYMKAYKNIETELALPIHQRTDAGKLLGDLREKMARISEVAPAIPSEIIQKYKSVFKKPKTSLPIIISGPENIHICRTGTTPAVHRAQETTIYDELGEKDTKLPISIIPNTITV
jgi:hypothetical protein